MGLQGAEYQGAARKRLLDPGSAAHHTAQPPEARERPSSGVLRCARETQAIQRWSPEKRRPHHAPLWPLAKSLLQCNKAASAALGERSILRRRPFRGVPANRCSMAKAKAAVVTGSTSGLGLAIALALARDGTHAMLK